MTALSKSKLLAYRQCPKRLWLEIHRPDLCQDLVATQASFAVGHQVGAIARRLYDPEEQGVLVDAQAEGSDSAFARTHGLLQSAQPIFEACFRAEGTLAFVDIMLPVDESGVGQSGKLAWRMVEVKSATSVKD